MLHHHSCYAPHYPDPGLAISSISQIGKWDIEDIFFCRMQFIVNSDRDDRYIVAMETALLKDKSIWSCLVLKELKEFDTFPVYERSKSGMKEYVASLRWLPIQLQGCWYKALQWSW